MTKKIILTICALVEAVLILDIGTNEDVSGTGDYVGGFGILNGSKHIQIWGTFWLFTVVNVVMGFVLLKIWGKPKSARTAGEDAG